MTLTEILENLSAHCACVTGIIGNIKVILPDQVIEEYTKQFTPKEKIKTVDPNEQCKLSRLCTVGGTVELIKESESK